MSAAPGLTELIGPRQPLGQPENQWRVAVRIPPFADGPYEFQDDRAWHALYVAWDRGTGVSDQSYWVNHERFDPQNRKPLGTLVAVEVGPPQPHGQLLVVDGWGMLRGAANGRLDDPQGGDSLLVPEDWLLLTMPLPEGPDWLEI